MGEFIPLAEWWHRLEQGKEANYILAQRVVELENRNRDLEANLIACQDEIARWRQNVPVIEGALTAAERYTESFRKLFGRLYWRKS